jgi:hypothetical protein
VSAQGPRKIGELELQLLGVSAAVEPVNPTVPKNTASAVRIVVRAGGSELSAGDVARFLGAGFRVEAQLSGPGLAAALFIPQDLPADTLPADPLLLPIPALTTAGDYTLSGIRIVAPDKPTLDATPSRITVKIIDQILVTSVKTRPLTLDEIKAKGIVLDSDDYLGFEFTLGMKLESKPVNLSFPVVFDRKGVQVPQPTLPPAAPVRAALPPMIVPMLLEAEAPEPGEGGVKPRIPLTLPNGQPIRIPSLLVIPGNVGYLKQFFSAQLFVANGAPVGSGLVVRDVTGTIKLPQAGEPVLALPETVRGPQPETMDVKQVGPDGEPGTADDVGALQPGEQGQAEFLIRGEKEGFHKIDFDIAAMLDGLPVGPVKVSGKASGGVLVRNAFFDVSFTVPSVVRKGEAFKFFVTVTNIGQGIGNDVNVTLDASRISGAHLTGEGTLRIDTLMPGDAETLAFDFAADRTGQVVASYLKFDSSGGASGDLHFTLGVGERGIALSPDTLVLPASVDGLPQDVVDAAMRVLGQAWSISSTPILPKGVIRTDRTVTTEKALALAEAGLRVTLGQSAKDAVRDLVQDFYGGVSLDPGFDQLLRQTQAGRAFALAAGAALAGPALEAGGAGSYEAALAQLLASGPDFISFAVHQGAAGAPVGVAFTDGSGRRSLSGDGSSTPPQSEVPGAVLLPLGGSAAPLLGLLTAPSTSPYVLQLEGLGSGTADVAVTLPRGDGTFARVTASGLPVAAGSRTTLTLDLARPHEVLLRQDQEGDGAFESEQTLAATLITPVGPSLISANVIGPETLSGAGPFGLQAAVLFDRVVDATSSDQPGNYSIADNRVRAAKRQLSGRLVFLALEAPEGPYVSTTLNVANVADSRGAIGEAATVPLGSRLEDIGAVVTGRVLNADGTPVGGASVVYLNNPNWQTCEFTTENGLVSLQTGADGGYELRYVRQDNCGSGFALATLDATSGALRRVETSVTSAGERLVLDIVLFGRGAVAGTVRNLAGEPVPQAQVVVHSVTDPQVGGTATTDIEGRYLIQDITVGRVSVRAGKGTGLGQGSGRIERAGTTAIVDLTLDSDAASVRGVVRKLEAGALTPVPGVGVVFSVAASPIAGTQTAADGSYRFDGMPTGDYAITAALNARDAASVSGRLAAGDAATQDILIEIKPPQAYGTVRGVVRFADGTPAAGAIADISGRGVLTDAEGRFEIPGVTVNPNISQTVSARTRDGKRRGTSAVTVSEPDQVVQGVVIVLSGLGSAVFTVLDPAGEALPGVAVGLLYADRCLDPCGCRFVTTDASGRAVFDGLPIGSVAAQAIRTVGGFTEAVRANASVPRDGDSGFAVLRFGGSGTVTGSVLGPDGQPVHGADVALSSQHFFNDGGGFCGMTGGVSHQARTGTDGRFRFTNVAMGGVGVTARQDFYPTTVGASGTLTPGQPLHFPLQLVNTTAGKLTGTVFLPDGVTPAGAGVEITASGSLPDVVVRTNDQGGFEMPTIFPQGGYTIIARDPVTGLVVREIVYLRAGENQKHDLRLKGRGAVRIRVVTADDDPVPSAFVRLRESEFLNRTYEGAVEPANQGLLEFPAVFEGPFSVEASNQFGGGRVSGVLPRGTDGVEVKVRFGAMGTVRGRFLMPDGKPIPFGTVKLIASGRTIGQLTTPNVGDVGAYVFEHVPAGQVRLEAQDPLTARTGVAYGTLTAEGEIVTLDVIAQGLGTVQGKVTSNSLVSTATAHVDVVSGPFKVCTFADSDGKYRIEGVPTGRIVVTASFSGGFLAGTAEGTLENDDDTLDLDVALREAGTLTGQVFAADGVTPAPISQVSLWVGGQGGGSQQTTTDGAGLFRFERVPEGTANLQVDVLGSIDYTSGSATVQAGPPTHVTLNLNGVGSISGVALGSEGNPTTGDLLLSAPPYQYAITLGSAGTFRFPEVLAGPFSATLRVNQGGLNLYGRASGTVIPGETASLSIQVQPSGTVKGKVVRANGTTPGFGAEVSLQVAGSGTIALQAQDDGSFIALGVPIDQTITVKVLDPVTAGRAVLTRHDGAPIKLIANGQVLDLGTIQLDDKPPVVVFVQPQDGVTRAQIGGAIVVDVSDVGVGVDPATVCVTYVATRAFECTLAFADGRATGSLNVGRLDVGTNVVKVSAKDFAGNEGSATISYTATGGTLRGRVLHANLLPADSVPVVISGLQPPLVTDENGEYSKSGLRPGFYSASATDPASGLASSKNGTLFDGELLRLDDIRLPAFGSIAGTVRHPGGAPAVGYEVATFGRESTTDGAGFYRITALGVGEYTLDATHANGDIGRTTVSVLEGAEANGDIELNGVGSLVVTVRSFTGTPVADAAVIVTTSSPFGGAYSEESQDNGVASFPSVRAGTVTAIAVSPTGLRGTAVGLVRDGVLTPLEVRLESAGRIHGSVFRFDGTPAGAGLHVSLSGPKSATATTEGTGTFAFEGLPLGSYEVNVTNPVNDDRGRTSSISVPSDGADVPVSVTLNGVGSVRVTVRDAGGALVDDALVSVSSNSPFGGSYGGKTDNGVIEFPAVRAGSVVNASATHPSNGSRGDDAGPLPAGGHLNLEVTLEPLATLRGRVLQPDGVTPAAGVSVTTFGRSATTDDLGAFELADLRYGAYSVDASVNGRLRARRSDVAVPGADLELVLVGVGTVTGILRDSANTALSSVTVSLTSLAPTFGGPFASPPTDGSGRYTIVDVPLGNFTITASRGGDRADDAGAVAAHGQLVNLDLTLLSSAITLPAVLVDANAVGFQIRSDARFYSSDLCGLYQGGQKLTLVQGSTSATFAGAGNLVSSEENKRELVIRQSGLLGLDVTRKVFVPAADGYFLRYVDRLHNAGAEPITVDVLFETASSWGISVVDSSSGDAVADASDGWIAYSTGASGGCTWPPSAMSFAGAGGQAPSQVSFDAVGATQQLATRWNAVTLSPGQSVSFLHVLTQQTDVARASASATRLSGLPPELLAGLSSEEAAFIRNFAVPGDLVSALAPLPPNDGVISGRALAGDGVTPVPGTAVTFRSRSPHFGRSFGATSAADGTFQISPGTSLQQPVPRTDFDLTASHSDIGGTATVSTFGSFPTGGTVDLTNMIGRVLRYSSHGGLDGVFGCCNPEYAVDGMLNRSWTTTSGDAASPPANGAPFFEIVFPADVSVSEVRVRDWRSFAGTVPRRARLELRNLAGEPLWSQDVEIPLTAAGYRDADIPVPSAGGVRSVRFASLADNGSSTGIGELEVIGSGIVGPTQRTTQDVVFASHGVVEGRVLRSDGSVVLNASVRIDAVPGPAGAISTPSSGYTPERYRFALVQPGSYVVQASHPAGGNVTASGSVTVAAGERIVADLTFAPFGSLQGSVRTAAGIATGATLTLTGPNGFSRVGSPSQNGGYSFGDVPAGGPYTLEANDSRNDAIVTQTLTIPENAAAAANVTFPPTGQIAITATRAGAPLAGALAREASDSRGAGSGFYWSCTTDAAGQCLLTKVPGETVRVRVEHPGQPLSFAETTVSLTSEAQTVPVELAVPGVGSVTGYLRARNGTVQPSPGVAALSIYHATENQKLAGPIVTDDVGYFSFTNVPVGPLRIRVWRDNYFKGEVSGELLAHGATLPLDALEPRGVLETPGREDLWQATYAEGESVEIRLDGLAVGTAAALADPYLEVFDPEGTLVAFNDNRSAADLNSKVAFGAPVSGTYLVVVRAAGAQTGGYRLGSDRNDDANVFRAFEGATLHGSLRLESGGPLAGATVAVSGGLAATTVTDPSGRYAFPLFAPGTFSVAALDSEGVATARGVATTTGVGEGATLDLVAPAREAVSVTVRRAAIPQPGVAVAMESDHASALPEDRGRVRVTNAAGQVTTRLPVGNVSVRATDPTTGAVHEAAGSLAAGAPLALELSFVQQYATLRGTVRNGDGLTALPDAQVSLSGVGATTTDAAGAYAFVDVPIGSYTVAASLGGVSASRAVTLAAGESVQDFNLALGVLRGSVRDAAAGGVSGAEVRACLFGECATAHTDDAGAYAVYGFPTGWIRGTVTVTAGLPGSPLQATSSFTLSSPTSTYLVDLVLPASGALRGVVRDADGAAVPEARVTIVSTGAEPQLLAEATANSAGEYVVPYVPVQAVRVYAQDGDAIPGEAAATVVANQETQADVALVRAGALNVSCASASCAPIVVAALETPRLFLEPWQRLLPGVPASLRMPVGAYRATFAGAGPAAAEGIVAAGETQDAALVFDGYLYRDQGPAGAFVDATVTGSDAFPEIVKQELSGRAVRTLLATGGGVRIRRQEFLPASEAFRRTLLQITNPGTTAVTVDARAQLRLSLSGGTVVATSSGDTIFGLDDSYAVAGGGGVGAAIVLGSALSPAAVSFTPGTGVPAAFNVRHSIELLPGETKALLFFSVTGVDEASATPLAQALAELSHPEALIGLTNPERAQVVNFAVPPTSSTGVVFGVVRDSDGELRIAFARVGAVRDGVIAAQTTADEGGNYSLSLPSGSYSLVAVDPGDDRPGRSLVTIDEGATLEHELRLSAQVGSVEARAMTSIASPAGIDLRAEVDGYAPFWAATAELDGSARAFFGAIPPGRVVVRPASPDYLGQGSGDLAPLGELLIEFALYRAVAVRGQVQDAAGAPVPAAYVTAFRNGAPVAETTADGTGNFSFSGEQLPDGATHQIGAFDPVTRLPGTTAATPGSSSSIVVRLIASTNTGTLLVRAIDDTSGARIPGARVAVQYGTSSFVALVLDPNGEGSVRVPAGFFITVTGGSVAPDLGWARTSVSANTTKTLDLRIGNRYPFPVDLTGEDAMPYFAFRSIVQANPRPEFEDCDPFCAHYTGLQTPDFVSYDYDSSIVPLGVATQDGREIEAPEAKPSSGFPKLRAVKKTFVPPSGRFARSLEVIENIHTSALTVSFFAQHIQTGDWSLGTTSSGDAVFDTADFFVTFTSADPGAPELAWVTAGPGPIAATRTYADAFAGSGYFGTFGEDDGQITLLPGQKAILMRFLVQRRHGQLAALQEQAEALMELTDPEALLGLTEAERALVKNFVVPQVSVLSGTARDTTGAPLPGARVSIVPQDNGVVLAQTTADAAGRFRIDGLAAGTYNLVIVDPASNRPGRSVFSVGELETVRVDTKLLGDDELGTLHVRGVREASGGAPVPGAVVTLFAHEYAPAWLAEAALDSSGRATFSGVPPSFVEVVSGAVPDYGGAAGDVRAGEAVELTLFFGTTVRDSYDLTGSDGAPYFTFGDGAIAGTDYDCEPFCGTYLRIDERWLPWRASIHVLAGGRDTEAGPSPIDELWVTRRNHVHPSGRFVRFLEILENRSAAPVTVSVYVEQDQPPQRSIAATSSGDGEFGPDDLWLITSRSDAAGKEALFVIAGAGASRPPTTTEWNGPSDWTWYGPHWHDVTLLPGQKAIFMSFVAVLPQGQLAEAAALAGALANLTEPDALAGLTAEERAAIVNFVVPQP